MRNKTDKTFFSPSSLLRSVICSNSGSKTNRWTLVSYNLIYNLISNESVVTYTAVPVLILARRHGSRWVLKRDKARMNRAADYASRARLSAAAGYLRLSRSALHCSTLLFQAPSFHLHRFCNSLRLSLLLFFFTLLECVDHTLTA